MSVPSSAGCPPAPTNHDQDVHFINRNQLVMMSSPFGIESLYCYEPGGCHPTHLGDSLGPGGRYRVIHKLGSGGFATVWLCRDTQEVKFQYVALKILMADCPKDDCPEFCAFPLNDLLQHDSDRKQNICLALDNFQIEGANGSHLCFVYPFLGPRILHSHRNGNNTKASLRGKASLALQVTRALATLHEFGICHGDLHPSNVLLRSTGLQGLPEHELIEILGEPRRASITTASGEQHSAPGAPQYLVYPIDFTKLDAKFLTNDACIIDFGQAFEVANPPEYLGTPATYRAPELILENKIGRECDLWALACTLFEIRTGRELFGTFDDDTDELLDAIVRILGKLPEPLWSKWEGRNLIYEEEADALGRAVEKAKEPVVLGPNVWIAAESTSIQEAVLWKGVSHEHPDGSRPIPGVHFGWPNKETELFADLLGKLLAFDPEKRMSAQEASEHEWFKFSDEEQQTSQDSEEEAKEQQQETSEEAEKASERAATTTESEQNTKDGQEAGVEVEEPDVEVQEADAKVQAANQAVPSLLEGGQKPSENEESIRPRRHSI